MYITRFNFDAPVSSRYACFLSKFFIKPQKDLIRQIYCFHFNLLEIAQLSEGGGPLGNASFTPLPSNYRLCKWDGEDLTRYMHIACVIDNYVMIEFSVLVN